MWEVTDRDDAIVAEAETGDAALYAAQYMISEGEHAGPLDVAREHGSIVRTVTADGTVTKWKRGQS